MEGSPVKAVYTPDKKKMIFFDVNHTLVDERGTFDRCFAEALQDYTGRWDADDARLDMNRILEQYKTEWTKTAKTALSLQARRKHCLARALKPYPFPVTERLAEALFAKIEELKASQLRLFPDTAHTIEALSRAYSLSIVSNGGRAQLESLLRRLGLDRFFPQERLFTGVKKGVRKPHPAMFQLALQKTGVPALQAVMVGNSWKNDIYGATRCGMDAVWLHPSHKAKISQRRIGKEKVIIIRKIRQLLDIFQH